MKTTTIIIPGCELGGTAKTTGLAAISDYLKARGHKIALFDCDVAKTGDVSSFSHWFGPNSKINTLDLRDESDCTQLFRKAAVAEVPFVVVDLPANSSGDLFHFLDSVVDREMLESLGLKLLAVGCISNAAGSTDSVQRWISMLGDRASWLITLNRIQFERVVKPVEVTFSKWIDWLAASEQTFPTVEIPHLPHGRLKELLRIGKLPSLSLKDSSIDVIERWGIQKWIKRVHTQLDQTGLFELQESLVSK